VIELVGSLLNFLGIMGMAGEIWWTDPEISVASLWTAWG